MTTRKHEKGYRNTRDEVYGNNPICSWCEHAWPCDSSVLEDRIIELEAELKKMIELVDQVSEYAAMPINFHEKPLQEAIGVLGEQED